MSLWELLVKETMEKQSDGLGVLVMLISCGDLVIMEGIWVTTVLNFCVISWDPLQSRLQSAFHQQNLGFQEEHFKNVHLLPGIHGRNCICLG